jgi:hypothetical protein
LIPIKKSGVAPQDLGIAISRQSMAFRCGRALDLRQGGDSRQSHALRKGDWVSLPLLRLIYHKADLGRETDTSSCR